MVALLFVLLALFGPVKLSPVGNPGHSHAMDMRLPSAAPPGVR